MSNEEFVNETGSPEPSKNQFPGFLQKEYDNIANAHFKTTEMISEYIKHYLTIASVPFAVMVIIANQDFFRSALANNSLSKVLLLSAAVLCIFISFTGMMFFWYILNLRWDALLYARTINGIRKYFFDRNETLDKPNNFRTRVLPQSPYAPGYREFTFFGPVVIVFTTINTIYFFTAMVAWEFLGFAQNPVINLVTFGTTTSFIFFHLFLYFSFAQRRELSYLHSNIIGVDIDGVLNNQKEHFCEYLKNKTGINISPNQITATPVHDCEGLGVQRSDEIKVLTIRNIGLRSKPRQMQLRFYIVCAILCI